MNKVIVVLDVDAIRRAERDPAQFVESLKSAALTRSPGVYASSMAAGRVVWRGNMNAGPTIKFNSGLTASLKNDGSQPDCEEGRECEAPELCRKYKQCMRK